MNDLEAPGHAEVIVPQRRPGQPLRPGDLVARQQAARLRRGQNCPRLRASIRRLLRRARAAAGRLPPAGRSRRGRVAAEFVPRMLRSGSWFDLTWFRRDDAAAPYNGNHDPRRGSPAVARDRLS
ncbi:MAG: hypothetical protein ACREOE_01280 [Gemmatimonadales bacterium]